MTLLLCRVNSNILQTTSSPSPAIEVVAKTDARKQREVISRLIIGYEKLTSKKNDTLVQDGVLFSLRIDLNNGGDG